MNVSLRFNFGGVKQGQAVRAITQRGFRCEGSLVSRLAESRSKGTVVNLEPGDDLNIQCTRETAKQPFPDRGRTVYAKEHSVVIDTSGGNLVFQEPAILAGPSARELETRIKNLEDNLKTFTDNLDVVVTKDPTQYGFSKNNEELSCPPGEVVMSVRVGNSENVLLHCAKVGLKKK